MSTSAGGNVSGACPPFVTREEINSLLVVCRNYKVTKKIGADSKVFYCNCGMNIDLPLST
jgi:hypothetical protein